ncbi:MAG: Holliday junction resolvase RuvX [Candidatus Kapabacteria bacterium]|nr:Holliday junction resolvase RuvX [Candidatus Kapabacteria bacterium]
MSSIKIQKGKRIGSIDYGRKRIGFAVSDEMLITVSAKEIFYTDDENFKDKLLNLIKHYDLSALVVGLPIRLDNVDTELILEIKQFAEELKTQLNIPVFFQDESFSSKSATETMIRIGKRKKFRSKKEEIDKIAACIILRDFIEENIK